MAVRFCADNVLNCTSISLLIGTLIAIRECHGTKAVHFKEVSKLCRIIKENKEIEEIKKDVTHPVRASRAVLDAVREAASRADRPGRDPDSRAAIAEVGLSRKVIVHRI